MKASSTATGKGTGDNYVSSSMMSSSATNIKVIARFRPENQIERDNNSTNIVQFLSEDSCQINSKEFSGTFTFDRVFNTDSKQEEVFEYSLRQTVDDLMKGYNGTVLAYGQTGSGKSYTMMGKSIDDFQYRGAIPRIIDQIFEMILQSSSDIEYTVRVSYMEIYMEKIKDLLNPRNDNLPIHEDKARGVYVRGLTEEYVSSAEEVYEVMRQGGKARAVAATNMNQESSRSHSIFAIVVTQKHTVSGTQKSGQLFLVDLAGSEKVGKTGASGQTLEEAKKINKSLSALGLVINSLTDGKSVHVPYRDSKLTRILQESLGGNSRTSLIVNCSPSSFNDAETLSTLRFGVRAKNIKNKAKINTELSPLELRQLLKKSQRQLEARALYSTKLESELVMWRNGEAPSEETWVKFGELSDRKRDGSKNTSSTTSVPVPEVSTPKIPEEAKKEEAPAAEEVDSMEEYIRRETELQEQLTEKETLIAQQEEALFQLRQKLSSHDKQSTTSAQEIGGLKLEIDNLSYEKKELEIKSNSVKEENDQLSKELQEYKRKVLELEASISNQKKEEASSITEKSDIESMKKQKMDEIFNSLYGPNGKPADGKGSEELSDAMSLLENLNPEDEDFHSKIQEAKEKLSKGLGSLTKSHQFDIKSIEQILKEQESAFHKYLDGLDASDDVKAQIEGAYESRLKMNDETASQLLAEISRLQEKGQTETVPLSAIQEKDQAMQAMQKQFEEMMTDRCERIVQLELSLDQARAQYNLAIRDTNNKQQQRKMTLLQRNLEQLTTVQRQLVEQNLTLKKDLDISQKILDSRNDRIGTLENALRDSQNRLNKESEMFETKLEYLRDRLAEVKNNNMSPTRSPATPILMASENQERREIPMVESVGAGNRIARYPDLTPQAYQGHAGTMGSTKIVKPLRGGGGGLTGAKEGLWTKLNSIVNNTLPSS